MMKLIDALRNVDRSEDNSTLIDAEENYVSQIPQDNGFYEGQPATLVRDALFLTKETQEMQA